MTDYFVGIGGNDGNTGLSWAQRFLTLNAAEDEPVAAGDTVYVGPGVYREQLTVDVSGSSGNPITYIGDVSGENTDGIGGIVRITGSDDDQSGTRTQCITSTDYTYRTFRGFAFDMATVDDIKIITSADGWIIEDCYFGSSPDDFDYGIELDNPTASDTIIIRRCIFVGSGRQIFIWASTDRSLNSSSVIENCMFIGAAHINASGIHFNSVDTATVKNCIFYGLYQGIRAQSLANNIDVNDCIIENCNRGMGSDDPASKITEDYNSIPLSNNVPRFGVDIGVNSNTYPSLFEMPVLLDTFTQFPWKFGELSKWSQLSMITGSSSSLDDLYGSDRPTTKQSWGAIQYKPGERETTTTYDSSAASIKLADAGRHQIFIPVTAVSTTIAVRIYREGDYAGTNPQMIIRQPGQSARTTTDAAAASQWNELTDTFTPDSETDYVIVELVSNNTAISGSYAAYFDALSVS